MNWCKPPGMAGPEGQLTCKRTKLPAVFQKSYKHGLLFGLSSKMCTNPAFKQNALSSNDKSRRQKLLDKREIRLGLFGAQRGLGKSMLKEVGLYPRACQASAGRASLWSGWQRHQRRDAQSRGLQLAVGSRGLVEPSGTTPLSGCLDCDAKTEQEG